MKSSSSHFKNSGALFLKEISSLDGAVWKFNLCFIMIGIIFFNLLTTNFPESSIVVTTKNICSYHDVSIFVVTIFVVTNYNWPQPSFLVVLSRNFLLSNLEPGPVRGGFRGYIVPGPGRVQVSVLSFGIAL